MAPGATLALPLPPTSPSTGNPETGRDDFIHTTNQESGSQEPEVLQWPEEDPTRSLDDPLSEAKSKQLEIDRRRFEEWLLLPPNHHLHGLAERGLKKIENGTYDPVLSDVPDPTRRSQPMPGPAKPQPTEAARKSPDQTYRQRVHPDEAYPLAVALELCRGLAAEGLDPFRQSELARQLVEHLLKRWRDLNPIKTFEHWLLGALRLGPGHYEGLIREAEGMKNPGHWFSKRIGEELSRQRQEARKR